MTGAGPKHILAATLGDCVHVAGVFSFLRLAEGEGCRTEFMGTRVKPDVLIDRCREVGPDVVAVSYRLSPESAQQVFSELVRCAAEGGTEGVEFVLGGTGPVCRVAQESGLFAETFDGSAGPDDILRYLRGGGAPAEGGRPSGDVVSRIAQRGEKPLLRHHYGRPTLEETEKGIRRIARAEVLDILSLGPDHNAQLAFFRPAERDPMQDGAGGVPVRRAGDLVRLYAAAQGGNYPLMRCYSGTIDVFRFAEVLLNTIRNAWCAVPLFWYNVLDGRGPRGLEESIRDAQELMCWHAERNVPVEVNESHHWSLRDAHDTVAVAAAYLAAYNARAAGVRHYVSQYMFNTPPGTSGVMDLAKMMAKDEMISSLASGSFCIYRQTRAGLFSFPPDPDMARGQLAYSTVLQMAMDPDIMHVVSFSEADHAATEDDVIASCRLVNQVIDRHLDGFPDVCSDERVLVRRDELMREAKRLLDAIASLGEGASDPLADSATLAEAVRRGYLDAPHLAGNPAACGQLQTRIIEGRCVAVDADGGDPVSEDARIFLLDQDRQGMYHPD